MLSEENKAITRCEIDDAWNKGNIGIIDPAAVEGSEKERSRAFGQVALQLTNRIRFLVILIEREKSGKV